MKACLPIGLAFGLAIFTSGCATEKLWNEQSFKEPSAKNLRLAFDAQRKDVLVCYEELSERAANPKPRAYYLFQNEKHTREGRKPSFVSPALAEKLTPIPIVASE